MRNKQVELEIEKLLDEVFSDVELTRDYIDARIEEILKLEKAQ